MRRPQSLDPVELDSLPCRLHVKLIPAVVQIGSRACDLLCSGEEGGGAKPWDGTAYQTYLGVLSATGIDACSERDSRTNTS